EKNENILKEVVSGLGACVFIKHLATTRHTVGEYWWAFHDWSYEKSNKFITLGFKKFSTRLEQSSPKFEILRQELMQWYFLEE
ncbi:UNVERIFIED_CONTAM: hypothetical protein NCL1_55945, partial [Trichonephila clavipes]